MLISIIVPVYKVEKYIHRCVDSILKQTFTDFELILVDDGSPDNCGAICDEYSRKDSRIHVIHKKNGGLSDARNAGIDCAFTNSDSEWITFIDSDDWIHPRYLEALYDALVETGCKISICGYKETTGEEPDVNEDNLNAAIADNEDFFCENNVNAVVAWGKLYKKDLLRDIRYPIGKLHEDEFTTYKLLFQYSNIAFIKQPLYFYFLNNNSITRSEWNPKRLDALEALNDQKCFFRENKLSKSYLFSLRENAWCIFRSYNMLLQSKYSNNTYFIRLLRTSMKRILRECKQQKMFLFSDESSKYFYEVAYPIEMKYYWYWITLKRKIKRK